MGDCFALLGLHAMSVKIFIGDRVGGAKHSPILIPHHNTAISSLEISLERVLGVLAGFY